MTGRASLQDGERTLLRHAAAVVRVRAGRDGYADLSSAAAADLGDTLEAAATAADGNDGVDRAVALALAHRLVDDDHPELSPMWPGSSS